MYKIAAAVAGPFMFKRAEDELSGPAWAAGATGGTAGLLGGGAMAFGNPIATYMMQGHDNPDATAWQKMKSIMYPKNTVFGQLGAVQKNLADEAFSAAQSGLTKARGGLSLGAGKKDFARALMEYLTTGGKKMLAGNPRLGKGLGIASMLSIPALAYGGWKGGTSLFSERPAAPIKLNVPGGGSGSNVDWASVANAIASNPYALAGVLGGGALGGYGLYKMFT